MRSTPAYPAATLKFASLPSRSAALLAPPEPGCTHSSCAVVLGLWARGPAAAGAMASRCIGAGHLAFLRGGPAARRAALAPIRAAGAASFPPSSPAIFPGSRSAGSARSCSARCENAAFSAPRILRSRLALALLSGAGASAVTGPRQVAAILPKRAGDRAAVCRCVRFARMG